MISLPKILYFPNEYYNKNKGNNRQILSVFHTNPVLPLVYHVSLRCLEIYIYIYIYIYICAYMHAYSELRLYFLLCIFTKNDMLNCHYYFFYLFIFSLHRDRQKLPVLTIFQVITAGYWEMFSISNNRALDKPHCL